MFYRDSARSTAAICPLHGGFRRRRIWDYKTDVNMSVQEISCSLVISTSPLGPHGDFVARSCGLGMIDVTRTRSLSHLLSAIEKYFLHPYFSPFQSSERWSPESPIWSTTRLSYIRTKRHPQQRVCFLNRQIHFFHVSFTSWQLYFSRQTRHG